MADPAQRPQSVRLGCSTDTTRPGALWSSDSRLDVNVAFALGQRIVNSGAWRVPRPSRLGVPAGTPAPERYTPNPMDDLYRDYILEHYRRPHNFGVLETPTASFEGANPLCGDRITMQLTVADGVVSKVGFTGRGCAISQASASLLTDEIKGKPLASVVSFGASDLLELLGIEISPARLKCAMLSFDSLQHLLDEVGAKPLAGDAG